VGRPLKLGLHSPFFGSTLGGGEKYLGVAAEAIRDAFPEHTLEIVSPVPVDRQLYRRMLDIDLSGIKLREEGGGGASLLGRLNRFGSLRRFRNLALAYQARRASRRFDLFLTMVYVIPAMSRARRSAIICQFPYELDRHPWSRVWARELRNFDPVICYSEFVRGWIRTYWSREAVVIPPPVDIPESEPDWKAKENIILSVGRFFTAGHNKRQDVMVHAFRELCDAGLSDWELHLAGSVHRDGPNAGYYESVVELAHGYPIRFHTEASSDDLRSLYGRASIYWHASGFGVSGDTRPIDLEHFGMTTAESMGAGAVPVVINAGGQPEVVRDGEDGYLWRDLDEMKARTAELAGDPALRRRLGQAARGSSRRFGRDRFKRDIVAALEPIIRRLEA
jgi:glycosyltransferase involved in cell wall biosynthesis